MSGWTALLGVTATVFTAPSFAIFSDLMTGWVLAPGRRTLTRVLTLADPEGRRAHDAYHRFVRAGAWLTGRLWRVLAVHAVGLCCPDGVLELLVDDTLAHKSGRKVAGAGKASAPWRLRFEAQAALRLSRVGRGLISANASLRNFASPGHPSSCRNRVR